MGQNTQTEVGKIKRYNATEYIKSHMADKKKVLCMDCQCMREVILSEEIMVDIFSKTNERHQTTDSRNLINANRKNKRKQRTPRHIMVSLLKTNN